MKSWEWRQEVNQKPSVNHASYCIACNTWRYWEPLGCIGRRKGGDIRLVRILKCTVCGNLEEG